MSLLPASSPGKKVICNSCRHTFPQDPPFEVPCPTCGANAGTYCQRPSGHRGRFVPFHRDRDLLALKLGFYDHAGINSCGPNSPDLKTHQLCKDLDMTGKQLQLLT